MLSKKQIAKRILEKRGATSKIDVLSYLFKEQLEFVTDPSPLKVAVCSRQAGKSRSAAIYLIWQCLVYPEAYCAYLALTRESAKRCLWDVLKNLNRLYKLKMTFNESNLVARFPNNSQIYFYGINTDGVGEVVRGTPWNLAVIDEAASFRSENLEYVIDQCLVPGMITRRGTLALIGTPTGNFGCYLYKAFHDVSQGYKAFSWTVFQNIFQNDPRGWVNDMMKRKGWTEDSEILRREYYGEWVRGDSLQVYTFNPAKNLCDKAIDDLTYMVGVDLGGAGRDATAIVVLGYNPEITRKSYIVHVETYKQLLISDLGKKLQQTVADWNAKLIVMDTGGLGASISQELQYRFSLPIIPAKKQEKVAAIELMNSDFVAGHIQIVDNENTFILQKELQDLVWKDETRLHENPACDNHAADAGLYVWRHCFSYLWTIDENPVKKEEVYFDEDEPEVYVYDTYYQRGMD